jgi:hypothetical protein
MTLNKNIEKVQMSKLYPLTGFINAVKFAHFSLMALKYRSSKITKLNRPDTLGPPPRHPPNIIKYKI